MQCISTLLQPEHLGSDPRKDGERVTLDKRIPLPQERALRPVTEPLSVKCRFTRVAKHVDLVDFCVHLIEPIEVVFVSVW